MQDSAAFKHRKTNSLLQSVKISHKKGLGRKLLIVVLLISSIFTIFQASYQLYQDYKLGLNEVDRQFEQIHLSYNQALARSIWEVDDEASRIIATGILSLSNVEYVNVNEQTDEGEIEILSLLTNNTENLTSKSYPLTIKEEGDVTLVGKLSLKISLAPLYSDLLDKLIFILIFQTIKTFSVSILIFAIFHYLVTQHLIKMSEFSQSIDIDNLDDKLILKRNKSNTKDELDQMVQALNNSKEIMKKMLASNVSSKHLRFELDETQKQEALNTQHRMQIELKNAELSEMIETLKETQEQLISSEKMALLGNMVKGVAHELNTPIGVSITGVSHLKAEGARVFKLFEKGAMTKTDLIGFFEETQHLSKSIDISLQKAAELIQSFKLVSVEQHQDASGIFNLHQNFDDITKSLQHTFKARNIQIQNDIPEHIEITSYPGIFYQIYTNLINNASLHAFENTDHGVIRVRAVVIDELLTLEFSDDGKGMPKEVLDQLLVPFFTTKRGSGGSGLAMSIVDTLVRDKLKGKMTITSEEGKGTKYTIIVNTNA